MSIYMISEAMAVNVWRKYQPAFEWPALWFFERVDKASDGKDVFTINILL